MGTKKHFAFLAAAILAIAALGEIVIGQYWPDPNDEERAAYMAAMHVKDILYIGVAAYDDEGGAVLSYKWGFNYGDENAFAQYLLDDYENSIMFNPADTNVFCGVGNYEIWCEVSCENRQSVTQSWDVAVVAQRVVYSVDGLQAALSAIALEDEPGEVYVTAGTYALTYTLRIYPNTTLTLDDDAVIKYEGEPGGLMLLGSHLNDNGYTCYSDGCPHGGYSQCSNVVVQGGTWDRQSSQNELSQAFKFHHASGITIRDLTIKNCSNHHFNLSGSENVLVDNVLFTGQVRYTGQDASFWGDKTRGDETRYYPIEAVHLDYLDSIGEASASPLDKTPCRNVLITNCVFDAVFAGAGVHHLPQGDPASDIKVVDCLFDKLLSFAVYFYGVENGRIENNTVTGGSGLVFASHASFQAIGNDVSDAKEYVVFANNSSSATVSGNIFENTALRAIHVCDGTTLVATRNTIQKTGDNAILLTRCGKSVVDWNTITDAAKAAILAMEKTPLYARNNTINSPGTHGIGSNDGSTLNAAGNTIRSAAKNGFVVNGGSATLSNNEVISPKLHGIFAENSAKLTATGNTIRSAAKNGIAVNGATATLSGSKIISPGLHGIYGESSAKVTATSNTIETPAYCGFSFQGKAKLATSGKNIVKNPKRQGVLLSGAGASTITGVQVTGCGMDGIRVIQTTGCTISKNTVSGVKGEKAGIVMEQCRSGTVTGNTVTGSTGHGIRVFGTKAVPSTVTVSKNNVTGAATKYFDIILGDYSKKCQVLDNILGRKRFTISKVGTSGNVYRPVGTSLTKLVRKSTTAVTAKWTKQTQTDGYELQYGTSSKFKKAKSLFLGAKATSKALAKLTPKKKLYVRIRTYHTVARVKYFSSWSKTMSIVP